MPRTPRKPPRPPRIRRDAATARTAILDAAEARLVRVGVGGIRLQDVAADVGVSHPTVLHHFGSREGLVKAVTERALAGLHQRLVDASRTIAPEADPLSAMMDGVFEALHGKGYDRVILWLALEGQFLDAPVPLSDVVDALHGLRVAKVGHAARREETAHAVVLAALALLGSGILGSTLLEHAGAGGGEQGLRRFRAWLSELLVAQIASPTSGPRTP